MISKLHHGKVKGGKFKPEDPKLFLTAFYPHEGKDVEVTVSRKRKHRSNKQNAYYHGVIVKMVAEFTGETPERTHQYLARMFLEEVSKIDDSKMITKSTTELSTAEFETYAEDCRMWASQFLNLYVPNPEEYI